MDLLIEGRCKAYILSKTNKKTMDEVSTEDIILASMSYVELMSKKDKLIGEEKELVCLRFVENALGEKWNDDLREYVIKTIRLVCRVSRRKWSDKLLSGINIKWNVILKAMLDGVLFLFKRGV